MSRRPYPTAESGDPLRRQAMLNHLSELHLAAFVDNYAACAQDAAQDNWPYEHYLATLTELEIDRRTQNRRKRRIQEARFPVLKELATSTLPPSPTSTGNGCSTWRTVAICTTPPTSCSSVRLAWAKPTLPLPWEPPLSPRPSRALLHRRRSEQ